MPVGDVATADAALGFDVPWIVLARDECRRTNDAPISQAEGDGHEAERDGPSQAGDIALDTRASRTHCTPSGGVGRAAAEARISSPTMMQETSIELPP